MLGGRTTGAIFCDTNTVELTKKKIQNSTASAVHGSDPVGSGKLGQRRAKQQPKLNTRVDLARENNN